MSLVLFQGFTTTRLAFHLRKLLLLLFKFFFYKFLFERRPSECEGMRRWEPCDVLARSERLSEVKRADFYLMNLAVLLQVYDLGIDLAVRWIVIWILFFL